MLPTRPRGNGLTAQPSTMPTGTKPTTSRTGSPSRRRTMRTCTSTRFRDGLASGTTSSATGASRLCAAITCHQPCRPRHHLHRCRHTLPTSPWVTLLAHRPRHPSRHQRFRRHHRPAHRRHRQVFHRTYRQATPLTPLLLLPSRRPHHRPRRQPLRGSLQARPRSFSARSQELSFSRRRHSYTSRAVARRNHSW